LPVSKQLASLHVGTEVPDRTNLLFEGSSITRGSSLGAVVATDLHTELGSIAEAIAQGRAIYANIRRFALYFFSCNTSEVLIVGLATLAGAPCL
jgi:magnesium-transporting ATPase (P-type)